MKDGCGGFGLLGEPFSAGAPFRLSQAIPSETLRVPARIDGHLPPIYILAPAHPDGFGSLRVSEPVGPPADLN